MFTKFRCPVVGVYSTGASGAFVGKYFTLNSCTALGGSFGTVNTPGFSTLCSSTAPYRSYIVHAVKVYLSVAVNTSTAGASLCIGIAPQHANGPAPGTMLALMGMPRARYGLQQVTAKPLVLQEFIRIGTTWGQSEQTVAIADSFASLYNTTPASQSLLHIGYEDAAGATVVQFNLCGYIDQYVELFGRNPPV